MIVNNNSSSLSTNISNREQLKLNNDTIIDESIDKKDEVKKDELNFTSGSRSSQKLATTNINKINKSIALLEKVRVEINNIKADLQTNIQDEETVINLKDISKSVKNLQYETENIFNNKLTLFDGDELVSITFSVPFGHITKSADKISPSSDELDEDIKIIDENIHGLETKLNTKLEDNINNLEKYYKTIDVDDEESFKKYVRELRDHKDIFNNTLNTLNTQNEIMFLLS